MIGCVVFVSFFCCEHNRHNEDNKHNKPNERNKHNQYNKHNKHDTHDDQTDDFNASYSSPAETVSMKAFQRGVACMRRRGCEAGSAALIEDAGRDTG